MFHKISSFQSTSKDSLTKKAKVWKDSRSTFWEFTLSASVYIIYLNPKKFWAVNITRWTTIRNPTWKINAFQVVLQVKKKRLSIGLFLFYVQFPKMNMDRLLNKPYVNGVILQGQNLS